MINVEEDWIVVKWDEEESFKFKRISKSEHFEIVNTHLKQNRICDFFSILFEFFRGFNFFLIFFSVLFASAVISNYKIDCENTYSTYYYVFSTKQSIVGCSNIWRAFVYTLSDTIGHFFRSLYGAATNDLAILDRMGLNFLFTLMFIICGAYFLFKLLKSFVK